MTETIEMKKKVCLFGDPGVGKSSLIARYVLNTYSDDYISTIGAKVSKKVVTMRFPKADVVVNLNLQIWDVMGQQEYRGFHKAYLQNAEGVLSVCDCTRRETFESMKKSHLLIRNYSGNVPVVYLINKTDLIAQSKVPPADIEELQNTTKIPTYSTSAKTGANVETAFFKLAGIMAQGYLAKQKAGQ